MNVNFLSLILSTSMKERCTPQTKPASIFIQEPPSWCQMDAHNRDALLTCCTEVAVDFRNEWILK